MEEHQPGGPSTESGSTGSQPNGSNIFTPPSAPPPNLSAFPMQPPGLLGRPPMMFPPHLPGMPGRGRGMVLPAHITRQMGTPGASPLVAPGMPVPVIPPNVPVPEDEWTKHTTADGREYKHNKRTGESVWLSPAEKSTEQREDEEDANEAKGDKETENPKEQVSGVWREARAADGRVYYYHSGTRETRWSKPAEILEKEQKDLQPASEIVPSQDAAPSSIKRPIEADADSISHKRMRMSEAVVSEDSPNKDANMYDVEEDSKDALTSGKPTEQDENAFLDLLREKKVSPFALWDKTLPTLIDDDRYRRVPVKSRRKLFEKYVKSRAQERLLERKQAKEEFRKLLSEGNLTKTSSFEKFEKEYGDDRRFVALDDEAKLRRKEYNSYVSSLAGAENDSGENKPLSKQERRRQEFLSLLKDCRRIRASSHLSDVKRELRRDRRYDAVGSREREEIFNDYIRELRKVREEEDRTRKAEREIKRRREIEMRTITRQREELQRKQALEELKCLYQEKIKKESTTWEEAKDLLHDKARWKSKDLLHEEKKRAFYDHIEELHAKRRQEFKSLLTDRAESFTYNSKFAEFPEELKSDPRFEALDRDRDREKVFDRFVADLLDTAKAAFRTLLKDGLRSITLHTKGAAWEGALEMIKTDPRWIGLDDRPDVRQELIEDYQKRGGRV